MVLSRLAGCWAGTLRHRISPEHPFQQASGTAENRWVLGGKFVEMTLRAVLNGDSWSAVIYVGHERGERRHVLVSPEPGARGVTIRRGGWHIERARLVLTTRHRGPAVDEHLLSRIHCELSEQGDLRLDLAEEYAPDKEFLSLQATYRPALPASFIATQQAKPQRRFVIA